MTPPPSHSEPDPFVGSKIGKLTVVARERRGRRWGYVCLCACGEHTLARRAEYIRRRGERAACDRCSVGVDAKTRVERIEPELSDKPRHLPSGHPIWRERAALLAQAIVSPTRSAVIVGIAKARFGWPDDLTREVLAAADGHELFKLCGLWQRNAARTVTSLLSTRGASR